MLAQQSGDGALDRPLFDAPETPRPAPAGSLRPYKLDALLARSASGEIFSAIDTRTGGKVAIIIPVGRVELPDPQTRAWYDVGPNFVVLDYIEGEGVAEMLRRGKLPVALLAE